MGLHRGNFDSMVSKLYNDVIIGVSADLARHSGNIWNGLAGHILCTGVHVDYEWVIPISMNGNACVEALPDNIPCMASRRHAFSVCGK